MSDEKSTIREVKKYACMLMLGQHVLEYEDTNEQEMADMVEDHILNKKPIRWISPENGTTVVAYIEAAVVVIKSKKLFLQEQHEMARRQAMQRQAMSGQQMPPIIRGKG